MTGAVAPARTPAGILRRAGGRAELPPRIAAVHDNSMIWSPSHAESRPMAPWFYIEPAGVKPPERARRLTAERWSVPVR